MSNLVIVALPREDDPVYKISSEKVPHLTILFMGPSEHEGQIAAFLQHAVSVSLTRFGLDVDRRGKLGPDDADVLFFQDNWELPRVKQFRDLLLKFDPIKTAYDSVDQYTAPQDWVPHLTLGYPTSPAKKSNDPIYWVQFDRVALWTGDYSGPEFTLEQESYPMDVAMGDISAAGRQFLAHHGVLGMRWGHRKSETAVSTSQGSTLRGKSKAKASGGEGHPAHEDALKVAGHKQIMRKSGMDALSNKQLQDMQTRMQLEVNVKRLHGEQQNAGKRYIQRRFKEKGPQFVETAAKNAGKQALKKHGKKFVAKAAAAGLAG